MSSEFRFLLANFQLRYVLREIGQSNMNEALKSLPASEIEAYEQIITRIRTGTERTSTAAIRTLKWIFHAARPLRMDELLEALLVEQRLNGINANDEKFLPADIVAMCHSLVIHEESSGMVRFIHFTVQEYLKSLKFPTIDLAKTCVVYLQSDAFDHFGLSSSEMEIHVQTYPLCLYVTQFWGFHVKGEAERCAWVQESLLRLLASERRRNTIQATREHATEEWSDLPSGRTELHIFAENGLVLLCEQVLKRQRHAI